jgi:hypothetical protein
VKGVLQSSGGAQPFDLVNDRAVPEAVQVRCVRRGERVGHELTACGEFRVRRAQCPDHDETAAIRRRPHDRGGRREVDDDAIGHLIRERAHLRTECAEQDPDVTAGRVADAERAATFAVQQLAQLVDATARRREGRIVCGVVPA